MSLSVVVMMAAETPKFTADQCRVLRQIGVDTRGICPNKPVKKPKQRTS